MAFESVFPVASWILAYTLCVASIGLFAYRWRAGGDRRVLWFGVVLADMTIVTAVLMTLVAVDAWEGSGRFVLLNVLSTYSLTIPRSIVESAGLARRPPLPAVASYAAALAAANLLLSAGADGPAFAVLALPAAVVLAPAVRRRERAAPAAPPLPLAFWKDIRSLGFGVFLVSSAAGFLYFLLAGTPLGASSVFAESYFAFFTIAYQLPCLAFGLHVERSAADVQAGAASPAAGNLTPRELEVALALCEGLTYGQTADRLCVSLAAVKKHVYNIYRKLGVANARQLMLALKPLPRR